MTEENKQEKPSMANQAFKQMGRAVRQGAKAVEAGARETTQKIQGFIAGKKGPDDRRGPQPKDGSPNRNMGDFLRLLNDTVLDGVRFAVKGLLALTVLTGFAKKETQEPVDNEPPKATLEVGTLGVRLMKASINNGNKETDFEGNMALAQGAKEVVGKAFPKEKQDKLFEENPISNGAFGKEAKDALEKMGDTSGKTLSPAEMARLKNGGRGG